MQILKNGFLAVLASAALVACGGGSDSNTTAATATLSGVASKGILKAAKATAYEVVAGTLKEVATTQTDATGAYSLKVAETNNPVIVKIETIAGTTKMLDESKLDSNGAYLEVDAPEGLTLRTMVESLAADRAGINANVFTEMAVSAAETAVDAAGATKPITSETFAAARSMVKQLLPEGVNPEDIKPLSVGEVATAADRQVMTLLTGLAASSDLVGDVQAMTTSMKVKVDDDGNATVTDDSNGAVQTKLAAIQTAGKAKLVELAETNDSLNDFVESEEEAVDYEAKTVASVNSKVENERSSLATFIATMKQGVEASESAAVAATKSFEERTAKVSFEMVGVALGGAFGVIQQTEMQPDENGYIVLTPNCYSEECDFELTRLAAGTYKVTPTNTSKITGSATMYGKFDDTNGSATFTYKGSGSQTGSGAVLGDFSIAVAVTGINTATDEPDLKNATITLKELSVNGVSDAGDFKVRFSLANGKLVSSDDGAKVTLTSDNAAITTDDQDSLSGKVTALVFEDIAGVGLVPRKWVSSFSGTLAGTEIVNVSLDLSDTTPAASYSDSSKQVRAATLKVELVKGTTLTLVAKDIAGKQDATINFTAGGNGIKITGDQNSQTITSSTGAFTAKLDADGNGDLMSGTTKFGDIVNGTLYYDGKVTSLF